MLFVCVAIKLFGANIFIAGTNNEAFIGFCNGVQNTFWYYIVTPLFNITSTMIFIMAVLRVKKPNWKWLVPYSIYAIIKSIFNNLNVLFFILDFVVIIGLLLIFDRKHWLRIIISVLLNLGFQFISAFLKLNNYKMFDDNLVVGIILSIDYYIMLILFWLYSIEKKVKGVEQMGVLGLFFFGEKDSLIIEEIAKEHNLPKEVVEKHYKEMLEAIKHEIEE